MHECIHSCMSILYLLPLDQTICIYMHNMHIHVYMHTHTHTFMHLRIHEYVQPFMNAQIQNSS